MIRNLLKYREDLTNLFQDTKKLIGKERKARAERKRMTIDLYLTCAFKESVETEKQKGKDFNEAWDLSSTRISKYISDLIKKYPKDATVIKHGFIRFLESFK